MNISYDIKEKENGEMIQLTLIENDTQIRAQGIVTKKEIKRLGNLIDRSHFPFAFVLSIVNDFKLSISKKLIDAANLTLDNKLRNEIIAYSKQMTTAEFLPFPKEKFMVLVAQVKNFTENI